MERLVESLLLPLADPDSRPEPFEKRVTLVLPTEGDAWLPSPELLFEREVSPSLGRRLAPWRVSGLTLSPEAALDWLVMLPTPEELDPHRFRLGAGIRYWSVAARFALELLARQRFLPALVPDEEAMLSRWEPLVEQEIDRFDGLREAMPPICRALSAAEEGELTSDALLRSFLGTLVDRLASRFSAPTEAALRRVDGRAPLLARRWRRGLRWWSGVGGGAPRLEGAARGGRGIPLSHRFPPRPAPRARSGFG